MESNNCPLCKIGYVNEIGICNNNECNANFVELNLARRGAFVELLGNGKSMHLQIFMAIVLGLYGMVAFLTPSGNILLNAISGLIFLLIWLIGFVVLNRFFIYQRLFRVNEKTLHDWELLKIPTEDRLKKRPEIITILNRNKAWPFLLFYFLYLGLLILIYVS